MQQHIDRFDRQNGFDQAGTGIAFRFPATAAFFGTTLALLTSQRFAARVYDRNRIRGQDGCRGDRFDPAERRDRYLRVLQFGPNVERIGTRKIFLTESVDRIGNRGRFAAPKKHPAE